VVAPPLGHSTGRGGPRGRLDLPFLHVEGEVSEYLQRHRFQSCVCVVNFFIILYRMEHESPKLVDHAEHNNCDWWTSAVLEIPVYKYFYQGK